MINDDRHPLYRVRRPIYWTGPAEDLGEAINVGIEFNRHGIIVRGDGRIGKTEGLGLLSRETKWRNYGMFWQRVLSPLPGQSTEGYFFNEIRLAACLKIRERSQSIFGVHHATDFFCESAAMIDAEVIVVSFDDANRLQREDYDHLATLDSHIAERGLACRTAERHVLRRCRRSTFQSGSCARRAISDAVLRHGDLLPDRSRCRGKRELRPVHT